MKIYPTKWVKFVSRKCGMSKQYVMAICATIFRATESLNIFDPDSLVREIWGEMEGTLTLPKPAS